MEVKINKEIREYTENIFFGLSLRQFFFSICACVIAVFLYFILKPYFGIETNITNWQRKQNANNNFSAIIPYDLEQQREQSKEFLDDLITRDQRMFVSVLTMVHTAETKEQLERIYTTYKSTWWRSNKNISFK